MSRGFVDPSITADSVRQSHTLAAIRARPGLSLHRLHRDGTALRLTGPNVHVLVSSLANLSEADLDAPSAGELNARARFNRK